jgi:hypothetical protein
MVKSIEVKQMTAEERQKSAARTRHGERALGGMRAVNLRLVGLLIEAPSTHGTARQSRCEVENKRRATFD